jgi:hypothetical protein
VLLGTFMLLVHMASAGLTPVLHWSERRTAVAPLMLDSDEEFHIFVSFVFRSGLQQAMAIKTMLQHALPGLRCFFAVDNLTDISLLGEIQRNRVRCMVSLLTGHTDDTGEHSHYFQSEHEPNGSKYCTVEFELMLLELKRPVVCLLETLQWQGGVTLETHHHACPDHLHAALESCPVVPFHREPGFKEATIRLTLQALLPCIADAASRPKKRLSGHPVFLPNEATRRSLVLHPPSRDFHLYISKANAGAEELVRLMQAEQKGWNKGDLLATTTSPARADFWMVHLSRRVTAAT